MDTRAARMFKMRVYIEQDLFKQYIIHIKHHLKATLSYIGKKNEHMIVSSK